MCRTKHIYSPASICFNLKKNDITAKKRFIVLMNHSYIYFFLNKCVYSLSLPNNILQTPGHWKPFFKIKITFNLVEEFEERISSWEKQTVNVLR